MMKEINVEANVDNLYKVFSFIEEQLTSVNCDIKDQNRLLIAIEEIFINIAKYAYKDGNGSIKVQVSF